MKLWRAAARARSIALCCLLGASCAMILSSCSPVTSQRQAIRPIVGTDTYSAALERISALDTDDSRLLYFYERGLILHSYGYYEQSNDALDRADKLLEDLYTRSLTRESLSLVVGDYLREYRGEHFEASLLHYYKILNYLYLDQIEDAAVESRRLNHRLQVIQDQGGSFYAGDPFLQYLTGLVYLMAGEAVEADVSLRVAYDSYLRLTEDYGVQMPASLPCDLADNSDRLGRLADATRHREQGQCVSPESTGFGTVRLLLECGHVPIKYEQTLLLPILKKELRDDLDHDAFSRELIGRRGVHFDRHEVEYLLKIAIPALRGTPHPIAYARIRPAAVDDSTGAQAHAVVVANLGVLATRSFEEHRAEVLLRTTARALAKYLAVRGAENKKNKSKARLANLIGVLTENADTRSWSALPDRILMASLELPPGRHDIEVELFASTRQRIGFLTLPGVEVVGGQSTILSHHVY